MRRIDASEAIHLSSYLLSISIRDFDSDVCVLLTTLSLMISSWERTRGKNIEFFLF